MVLKLLTTGETSVFFEGDYIQVAKTKRTDDDGVTVSGLPWNFQSLRDNLEDAWVAHVIKTEGSASVLFDCEAYVMESGKTVEHFKDATEWSKMKSASAA